MNSPAPASTEASQLFDGAYRAFVEAQDREHACEFQYRIAGHPVTLRFASRALVDSLTPAFGHLVSSSDAACTGRLALTICIWDGASTGVAPPAPAWTSAQYLGNTELPDYSDGRILAAFDPHLGMLSLYDVERRLGLFWLRDGTDVPITLVGTPFRILLQWWAAGLDGQLIHGAAVGSDKGAVAIVGASGAGKSTTALVALESGLQFLGDDFVLIRPEPSPWVFSLYSSAKVDDANLDARFPSLRGLVHARRRRTAEKEVLFVGRQWPERLASALPLQALLLPAIRPRVESRLVPVSPGDALRTLLPGVFPFPGQRQEAVARLGRLARRVPAYRLELGQDTAGIAGALHACVSGLTPDA